MFVLLKQSNMTEPYIYPGNELPVFVEARRWKKYFSKKLARYIRGSVLEVGAGMGETSNYLINTSVSDWTFLEPDKSLFEELIKNTSGFPLPNSKICGNISDLPPDIKFDTILYIDVLEHIEDDKKEIERALAHLNPGGHLIILSPSFQSLYSAFDKAIGHFRRYTKRSLREAINLNELNEKKIFYLESAGGILLFLNKNLFRIKFPDKKIIKSWDMISIPASKVLDKLLFHSFGKTIIGIWQLKNN